MGTAGGIARAARGGAEVQAVRWLKAPPGSTLDNRSMKTPAPISSAGFNRSNSIYRLLGGFVYICVYYLVFCDQSDDLVESIWVYWRILRPKKKLFLPKMIYRNGSINISTII